MGCRGRLCRVGRQSPAAARGVSHPPLLADKQRPCPLKLLSACCRYMGLKQERLRGDAYYEASLCFSCGWALPCCCARRWTATSLSNAHPSLTHTVVSTLAVGH